MASGSTSRSDEIIVPANIFLSQGKPRQAIELYTKGLYTTCPGYACALLNRSLAHLSLGHPELAVVDAYRAAMSVYGMRGNKIQSNKRYVNVYKYIRTERINVEKDKIWTGNNCRFLETNGVSSPLSSIVINDPPARIELSTVPPFIPTSRKEVCQQLEIRALYRLACALSRCGGGARTDALGLLDDGRTRYGGPESWEICEYERLGDSILNELFKDLEPSASRPGGQEVQEQIKAEMRSKATMIGSYNYPFNDFEPSLHVEQWQKYIVSFVQKCTTACLAHVITLSSLPVVSYEPYLELSALLDIRPGAKVLSERTVCNVTTSTPEDVMAKSTLESTAHFYCDTCATLLIIPGSSPDNYASERPNLVGRANSPEKDDTVLDPVIFPRGQASRSSPPSGHTPETGNPNASLSSDLMFCSTTHMAPSCCNRCRKDHEIFDYSLCDTNIERKLRKGQLNDLRKTTPDDRKIQCLQELLLFLRTLVASLTASDQTSHPLHDDDITFAITTPNNYQKIDEPQPWSFTNNVLRPLHNINQVCASLAIDPFSTLWQTDGWMINVLMSKISISMRISKGPRCAKIFNEHANLVTEYGKHDIRWNRYITPNEPDEENQIWIGSLSPVFNSIRIADPAKHEVPNVVVVQKTALHVYAISPSKSGEALLRAPDDEGPAPETWMLDEEEAWESESENESDDDSEVEEGEIVEGEGMDDGSEEGQIKE